MSSKCFGKFLQNYHLIFGEKQLRLFNIMTESKIGARLVNREDSF